jgi:uncharacterized membrane protein
MKLTIYFLSAVLLIIGIVCMTSGASLTGAVTGASDASSNILLFMMGVFLIATSFLLIIAGYLKTGFEQPKNNEEDINMSDEEFKKEFLNFDSQANTNTETERKPSN